MHYASARSHKRAIYLSIYRISAHTLYASAFLFHTCSQSLSGCRGVSRTCSLCFSLSLSLSDYYVPLFSLISVGKHYFSHMHIYTRTVSTSPLYAHICAYVSPARTLSLGLSRTHCPPPRHTSLLVVGRYDFIISFGRISLAVRLDGNTRQSFTLVRIGPLQLKKEPTPGTVY